MVTPKEREREHIEVHLAPAPKGHHITMQTPYKETNRINFDQVNSPEVLIQNDDEEEEK